MGITLTGAGSNGQEYAEKTLHLVGPIGAHTLDAFHIKGTIIMDSLHFVVHDVTSSVTCSGCEFNATDGVATLSLTGGNTNDLSAAAGDATYSWRSQQNAFQDRTTWSAGDGDIVFGEQRYNDNGPSTPLTCVNSGHVTFTYTADNATDLYITVRILYRKGSSGSYVLAV